MNWKEMLQEAAQVGVARHRAEDNIASAWRANYAQFPNDALAAISTNFSINFNPQTASSEKTALTNALVEEFQSLAKKWKEKTSFHSSLGEMFTNEEYQRIMAMGRDALPLILSDLQKNPSHWFYALEKIAGRDVAAEAGAKSFVDARSAWLEWGYKNNYI
jgi:hypothetical protein